MAAAANKTSSSREEKDPQQPLPQLDTVSTKVVPQDNKGEPPKQEQCRSTQDLCSPYVAAVDAGDADFDRFYCYTDHDDDNPQNAGTGRTTWLFRNLGLHVWEQARVAWRRPAASPYYSSHTTHGLLMKPSSSCLVETVDTTSRTVNSCSSHYGSSVVVPPPAYHGSGMDRGDDDTTVATTTTTNTTNGRCWNTTLVLVRLHQWMTRPRSASLPSTHTTTTLFRKQRRQRPWHAVNNNNNKSLWKPPPTTKRTKLLTRFRSKPSSSSFGGEDGGTVSANTTTTSMGRHLTRTFSSSSLVPAASKSSRVWWSSWSVSRPPWRRRRPKTTWYTRWVLKRRLMQADQEQRRHVEFLHPIPLSQLVQLYSTDIWDHDGSNTNTTSNHHSTTTLITNIHNYAPKREKGPRINGGRQPRWVPKPRTTTGASRIHQP